MKCKELMINDWITFSSENGIPMRVTNVDEDSIYANFEGNKGDPWEYDDKDYKPAGIPLTGEILEKNGFEQAIGGYGKISRSDDKNIYQMYIDFDRKVIEVYNSYPESRASNQIILKVNNFCVHELQHALRLAGLNDLADNFKVE